MSTVFAMKGSKERRFHGAHSHQRLEIRGTFHMTGPQPVDDNGGVPELVASIFDSMPRVMSIALTSDDAGVVWSRMPETNESGRAG